MTVDTESQFLGDRWYMVGWSHEIGQDLVRRRICDIPLLLFRKENGEIAALDDRCPHRFAPLSRGDRIGDTVRCGYHGLTFNANGACVHNPFSDTIPKGARVRSWRVVERDGAAWLWFGEESLSDSSLIPDFAMLSKPAGPPLMGYTLMKANYEYGTDNLMDLSHIEFVHRGSFAGAGVIFAGKHEVVEDGDTLRSNWWMPNVAAPGHTFGIYDPGMMTDHWLDMRWEAPASMHLQIGATPVGSPRREGVIVEQAHILVPETADTTHYFWATTRSFDVVTEQGDAMLKAMMAQAFDVEDKPTIEAAYANLDGGDFWDQRPVFLGIDAGGTKARRKIEQMRKRSGAPSKGREPIAASV